MQLNKILSLRWNKIILWVIIGALLALACWLFIPRKTVPVIVFPNKQKIALEFADTVVERAQGLSNRESLAIDNGMLFVFGSEGLYPFWMPEMKFSLDIIWLDSQYKIVYLAQNVPPATSEKALVQYTNTQPAKYVLEVNAGVTTANQLQVGDQLTYREIKSW